MQTLNKLIQSFFVIILICAFNNPATGQNPGDSCDPDRSIGHFARFGTITGTVYHIHSDGNRVQAVPGSAIQSGAIIQTASGSGAELIIEDGTRERNSRLIINESSKLSFTKGGLYCSDLRPIADGGRWSSRELETELLSGSMRFEIAEPVSYSFNAVIRTNNTVATMVRNRNEPVRIDVETGEIGVRALVPVMEHPMIQRHISGMLFGRNLNDLSPSELRAIQQHAVIAAISLGYLDFETEGYLDHPQVGPMVQMMTRGRNFDDLDENEKEMIAQAAGAILLDSGQINPEEVMIHDQPDERSVFHIHAGRFRLYNSHQGYHRDRVVLCEAGSIYEVRGYELPQPVL